MCVNHEYRVVYQRKGKVQRSQRYAILERAEKRRDALQRDNAVLYVRLQSRAIGKWQ